MKKKEYYLSTFERLKKYAGRLNRMIEDGSFYQLPFTKRYAKIRQVKRLYNRLRGPIGEKKLIPVLAAASIVVLGLSSCNLSGDGGGGGGNGGGITFATGVQNPFGLTSTDYAFPTFADLDGDGDMDLLVGELSGDLQYFQNTGTANAPAFAAPVQNPFGLAGVYSFAFPAFADLDGDGDVDLIVGELPGGYYGNLQYFENTGSTNAPVFAAPVQNPFGLAATTIGAPAPTFADLDSDGDFDLLVGDYYANFQYFENTGTTNAPTFAASVQNPFSLQGISPAYYFALPTFVDLDDDGDFDLLVGGYYPNLYYFENTGTTSAPTFAGQLTNPFGLSPPYYYIYPSSADLDDDGDMDILVGEYYGDFRYFENTTIP